MRQKGVRLLSTGVLINAIVAEIDAEEAKTALSAAVLTRNKEQLSPIARREHLRSKQWIIELFIYWQSSF